MAAQVEVRNFVGGYAHLNTGPTTLPIEMPELVNKAITVGGISTGSPRQRTLRRSSIANMVLSSVQPVGSHAGMLAPTRLYENTESTEKGGVSFRLGMALAAAVAARVLRTKELAHIPSAPGGGRRADLFGRDRLGHNHVVEAKARAHGIPRSLQREAKGQAAASRAALEARGLPIATASASLANLAESVSVLLVDPPASEKGGPAFEFSEKRFLSAYYSPVDDLLEVTAPEKSGVGEIDAIARGAWLPGALVWLGRTSQPVEEPLDPDPRAHLAPDGHAVVLAHGAVEPQERELPNA